MWEYIVNRAKEPGTWQGIIVFIAGAVHFEMPPELQANIIGILVFLFGSIQILKKDAKSPDAKVSPQAVANGKIAEQKALR